MLGKVQLSVCLPNSGRTCRRPVLYVLDPSLSSRTVPGWRKHHVGGHLGEKWDDGPPKVLISVPAINVRWVKMLRGDSHIRVVVESEG